MRKIKVLHLIGSGALGGAEKFVYQLARHQQSDEEIESAIMFMKARGPFYEEAVKKHILSLFWGERQGIKHFFSTINIFRNYDILHFHGLYPSAFLASVISGVPAIHQVHGARALGRNIKEVILDSISYKRRGKTYNLKGVKRFINRHWLKLFLKYKVREILVPSDHYISFYSRVYGIHQGKMVLIPLGVDPSLMTIDKSASKVKEELKIINCKIVGCVSTFRKLKRIDRLLEGFSLFLEKSKGILVRLLIVGDGSERVNIERKIKDLNIESMVIITGFRNDLPDLLQIMDLFVLPSESESFSLSIVEAMFFKLPVLVFRDSGGAKELVEKSKCGVVVDDKVGLATEIQVLLENQNKSREIGNVGYKYARNNFSIASCSKNIRVIYNNIIANHKCKNQRQMK
jgi:glycosyltransferase involved in cell wall biosynthesis